MERPGAAWRSYEPHDNCSATDFAQKMALKVTLTLEYLVLGSLVFTWVGSPSGDLAAGTVQGTLCASSPSSRMNRRTQSDLHINPPQVNEKPNKEENTKMGAAWFGLGRNGTGTGG